MKPKNIWKFIWIILIVSIIMGVLIQFEKFVALANPSVPDKISGPIPHDLISTLSDVFISSLIMFIAFIINYYIIRPLNSNRKINWIRISIAVVTTVISVVILSDVLFMLKNMIAGNNHHHGFMFMYFFRDLLIAAVVIIGVFLIKLINDRQVILIENEKLANENLLSQYETLKRQVSPHFFFNSLTTLKELISQEPQKAEDYINHLSLVIRHTLQNNENRSQSLKDELIVLDSFLFLVKIRFENNLRIIKNIDPKFEDFHLPSLALQTLIENAIKHNEVSKRRPLDITIETTTDQSVKIRNNLQEKSTPEHSTGTGLINLSRQYQYLSGKEISISKTDKEFCVEIPLLNPGNHESTNR